MNKSSSYAMVAAAVQRLHIRENKEEERANITIEKCIEIDEI